MKRYFSEDELLEMAELAQSNQLKPGPRHLAGSPMAFTLPRGKHLATYERLRVAALASAGLISVSMCASLLLPGMQGGAGASAPEPVQMTVQAAVSGVEVAAVQPEPVASAPEPDVQVATVDVLADEPVDEPVKDAGKASSVSKENAAKSEAKSERKSDSDADAKLEKSMKPVQDKAMEQDVTDVQEVVGAQALAKSAPQPEETSANAETDGVERAEPEPTKKAKQPEKSASAKSSAGKRQQATPTPIDKSALSKRVQSEKQMDQTQELTELSVGISSLFMNYLGQANGGVSVGPAYVEMELIHGGDRSLAAQALQLRLHELGYLTPAQLTQVYDAQTDKAMRKFLYINEYKLSKEAESAKLLEVDAKMQDLLYKADAVRSSLLLGEGGELAEEIQSGLYKLGYLTKKQLSGSYDKDTKAALDKFIWANGLDEPEWITEEVAAQLSEKNAVEAIALKGLSLKTSSHVIKFLAGAQKRLDCPYVLGNEGPDSFDCSGFVYYSLKQAGVRVGRMTALSYSQNSRWMSVKSGDLRAGDLLFFKSDDEEQVNHAAIYLGGSRFIHASSSKKKVVISSMSAYWRRNLVVAKRVM